ncbi:MAG: glucans biosynthesis glucosyltransferase MdoH [Hyphomicrobiales bacterium]|nr:MAG: glucans biosynthesis glucosyltransferase MdoH [Hyphomicrobiales bacterium]
MDQQLTPDAERLWVPAPSPLAMPPQALRAPRRRRDRRAWGARVALLLLVAAGTIAFGVNLYAVLSVQTPTWLQLVFWFTSTLCFAWIAIGAASALIGFVLLSSARKPVPECAEATEAATALLFPVYREDPANVAAGIAAMARDLSAGAGRFDVFILSDTQDEAHRIVERATYARLTADLSSRLRLHVRWRAPNTAKKAGNIQEWVTTHGGAYRYFVILDADSVMTAETLRGLVATMEREPRLGLLQTVPRLVGSQTVFARAQQFASAYYGPLVAAGIAAWQGDSGNYWGHNAIIRTAAFAASAGLPDLPGKPPLGGHILSHDFVEAALLVRGGWHVRLTAEPCGSYEGCPPTMTDLLVRDRRWAQGNLQHLKIVRASGLAALSRVNLALGAWSYLASPVWALTLVVGVLLAFEAKFADPTYFGNEISLFPKWPVFDAEKALALFIATLAIVHLPKLLGIVWAARSAESRQANRGLGRLVGGALLESLLATIIAPILMVGQTAAVLAILLGRDAGWSPQRRSAGESAFDIYLRQYRWHMAWGLLTTVICGAISWHVLAWLSPVILGLLASAPIAMATARPAPVWLSHLLATPEDLDPPPLLAAREALLHDAAE